MIRVLEMNLSQMASEKREGRGEREERREESERLGREERERRSLSAAVAHALLMVTRVYFPFHKTLRTSNAALQ